MLGLLRNIATNRGLRFSCWCVCSSASRGKFSAVFRGLWRRIFKGERLRHALVARVLSSVVRCRTGELSFVVGGWGQSGCDAGFLQNDLLPASCHFCWLCNDLGLPLSGCVYGQWAFLSVSIFACLTDMWKWDLQFFLYFRFSGWLHFFWKVHNFMDATSFS